MPGNIAYEAPTLVFPQTLSTAFAGIRSYTQLRADYHDGSFQAKLLGQSSRRIFKLAKKLNATQLGTLRAFWDSVGGPLNSFFFYNPFEGITVDEITSGFGSGTWGDATGFGGLATGQLGPGFGYGSFGGGAFGTGDGSSPQGSIIQVTTTSVGHNYDPTGVSASGRFTVVFRGSWSETTMFQRTAVPSIELEEVD